MKDDFKKSLACYRARRGRFDIVDVPALQYLMIDGAGDPNSALAYRDAISALFPLAYAIKFMSKKELDRDYVVMPLEALWWAEDMDHFTAKRDKSQWKWTAMIMTPDWIDAGMVENAKTAAEAKVATDDLADIRLGTLAEGICVQTLHVGPYDDESETLAAMHTRFLPDNRFVMTGRHHEIYLSDARRVEPSRLRTILRQPVRRPSGMP